MFPRLYKILFLCAAFILASQPIVHAQETNSDKPLEITADKTLEWHRNDQKYIARGKAIAKQGDVTIAAETLTANYRETKSSSFDIYNLTATDKVIISSKEATATGDKAVYEVDKGLAIMTGENLSMVSPEQTVTARDSFEYFVTDGKLIANGAVKVIRAEDTIAADKMTALFNENAQGKRELNRLEASGHVIITTPTETLTGDKGHYNARTNIAEISGNVKIARGPNILEGERAEVNLTTNVSKMFGGATQGGRVSATFYPNSTKEEDKSEKAPAPTITPEPVITPPANNTENGGLLTTPQSQLEPSL